MTAFYYTKTVTTRDLKLEVRELRNPRELLRHPRRQGPSKYAALRMAPMIDMIFLLLIFFLVAAKWRPHEYFLPLRLAAAGTAAPDLIRPEPLEIYISAEQGACLVRIGSLRTASIENQTLDADLAALLEKLRLALQDQKRYADDPVEIICDADVKWRHLARIYNLLYGAGLTDITFRTTD